LGVVGLLEVAGFVVVDFLSEGFVVVDFLSVDFLSEGFVVVDFLSVDFLSEGFVAGFGVGVEDSANAGEFPEV
jgi:hypothetical protein